MHLIFIRFPGFFSHIEGANRIFIFSGGFFVVDIDTPAEIDSTALYVTIPQANKFTRAQTGCNTKAIRKDILIKDGLTEIKTCINFK